MSENSSKFIIQSKIDIGLSTLLNNICDITEITEPILLECPGDSLETFVTFINHYENIKDEHDEEFEKDLYDSATSGDKQKLIKLIQDLCILDCDFFLDSISDYILQIFGNEEAEMDWNDIQIYLGLENDFSEKERKLMEKSEKLEYFLSLDTENFKFPFPNKSLYSLKTDFSTPMNCLLSRIVQRSNEKISYLLSLINKTIKNEVDRYPLKLTRFFPWHNWNLTVVFKKLKRYLHFTLNSKEYDEKYFKIIKKRKVIAKDVLTSYGSYEIADPFMEQNSLNFVTSKIAKITFCGSFISTCNFDLTNCSVPTIFYYFNDVKEWGVKFEVFYNHLIAKDLSKKIEIYVHSDIFKFFSGNLFARYCKKPSASKFYLVEIHNQIYNHTRIHSTFKTFVMKYMEDDGIIKSSEMILGIPLDEIGVTKSEGYYSNPVSDVIKYLDSFVTL